MKKLFFICVAFTGLFFSCQEKKETQTTEEKEESAVSPLSPDSLKKRIDVVRDSMNTSWNKMIASDDQKIQDLKRLLQEITYTKAYDPGKVEKLSILADSVKSVRYTQDSMTSSQIDQYDAATEKLIKQTFLLVENTPEMASHTITETLKNDIMKAESEVVNQRVLYDRWAKEYNDLLDGQGNTLQQLGEPYSSYTKKPIFELPS